MIIFAIPNQNSQVTIYWNNEFEKELEVDKTSPNSIKNSFSSYDMENRKNVSFREFPCRIQYTVNLIFIGINRSHINISKLLETIPTFSQISRYVPLSFEYETYIDYSINYKITFMEENAAKDLSYGVSSYGNYPYTLKLGLYWNQHTNINYYQRLRVDSVKNWIDSNFNKYKTDEGKSISINSLSPTIFFINMFTNGSKFYVNSDAIPHTYYLEKNDIDTGTISNMREYGKLSPGFAWEDKRWLFLDLSSGPSEYENIWNEYTNFIEYLNNSITANDAASELTTLIQGVVLGNFLPTYLYEPRWQNNIELCISLYYDENFTAIDYLNINKIQSSFNNLLFDRKFTVHVETIQINDNDDLDIYLDEISGYTEYATWAQKLSEFVKYKEFEIFTDYNTSNTERHLIGLFATSRITGKDTSLGFTYGELGTGHPLASVVTISPNSIISEHEGLTQTTIHELGHSLSLRHPHDFRYYGKLYRIWTWDTASTPLSYLHSVYDWNILNKDVIYRGNIRYLFNKTRHNIKEIRNHLQSIGFPKDAYPLYHYNSLKNISSIINSSLDSFVNHNYQLSLINMSKVYIWSNELLTNVTYLPKYTPPIVDFNTVNDTNVDYGNDLIISGTVVSYNRPTLEVFNKKWNNTINITTTIQTLGQYESKFSEIISSILYGEINELMIIFILINDDVVIYYYRLLFKLSDLKISIISPTNKMEIDLSLTNKLKIIGNFYSYSNSSRIQILFGHYWFVKDRYSNNSYWKDVNKSLGDEWIYNINISTSNFTNGHNLIFVRIFNDVSEGTDEIVIYISGLPESIVSSPSNPYSTDAALATNENDSPIEPQWTWIFIGVGGALIFTFIGSRKLYSYRLRKKMLTKKISSSHDTRPRIDELKTKIAKTEVELKKIPISKSIIKGTKKKEFKPKRRR